MKGVILAAGKGSRLFPVTLNVPKPLLPLANRLTLEYAFDRLKEMGVTNIGLVVGDSEPDMRAALGDGNQFGVHLTYIRQHEPKGLAHAVGFAKEFVGGDSFVLYLGDAVYGDGFSEFAAVFKESGCANLNIVKEVADPRRFGVVNVVGDRIVKLVEKPPEPESNLAIAGLYFFGPQIWDVLPGLKPSTRGEYEITDAIQLLVDGGHDVRAGVFQHEWFDTGTLDSFLETSRFLTDGCTLVGANAHVKCASGAGHSSSPSCLVGSHVVVGDGANVTCAHIEDSVILPGAHVVVAGTIKHSLIGGTLIADRDVVGEILFGE